MSTAQRLAAAGLATVLAAALSACGGGGSTAASAAGTFVGAVADPAVSVAVVADPAPGGQAERAVKAVVYGDSKNNIQEFFEGAAAGNELNLASDSGATLIGSVAADATSGKVTLADGRTLEFRAVPATGAAGWYSVIGLKDQVKGTSTAGGTLEAGFTPGLAGPGLYMMAGTVAAPNGPPMSFTVPFVVPEKPQPFAEATVVVIASSDGTVRGGAKKKKSGGGTGFHDLLIC